MIEKQKQKQKQNSVLEPLEKKGRDMKFIVFMAISVSMILFFVKLIVWYQSQSVALLASMVDSAIDLMVSFINLFVICWAVEPADNEHRFGHGKLEALAAFIQGIISIVFTAFLIYEASRNFFNPTPILQQTNIILVSILAIVLTVVLVWGQIKVIKKTKSLVIKADLLHYKSDLYINISVIISTLTVTYTGLVHVDAILGFIIAILLIKNAYVVLKEAINQLMDRELPQEERKEIADIIIKHKKVLGMHDLRTRNSGIQKFIQCHVELDEYLTLLQAHKISDEVETMFIISGLYRPTNNK